MLQSADSQTISNFRRRVIEITPIKRMIVFGSRARGNASKESDLDVFIELPMFTSQVRQKILEIAWETSLDREVVISVFITSTEMLTNGPLAGNPILRPILEEGIPV
jgi:predicted nucleotidyltransferase